MKKIVSVSTLDNKVFKKSCQAIPTTDLRVGNRSQSNIAQVGVNRSQSNLDKCSNENGSHIPVNGKVSGAKSGANRQYKGASKAGKGGKRGRLKNLEGTFDLKHQLFSDAIGNNEYLTDRTKMYSVYSGQENLTYPLNIDTEFNTPLHPHYQQQTRTIVASQVSGIHSDAPKIMFAQHESVNAGREKAGMELCPTIETLFDPLDYLRVVTGCEISIKVASYEQLRLQQLPKLNVVLYGHFLTAELNAIARGSVKTYLKQLQRNKEGDRILSNRRVQCQSTIEGKKIDKVSLQHIVTIDGNRFELTLKLVDTGAVHGIASYAALAEAVGHHLEFKNLFNSEEKGRIIDMARERARDFENYGIGDLDCYEILEKFDTQWKVIYDLMGVSDYYRSPNLTIGSTVNCLFEASLAKYLELEKSTWVKDLKGIVDVFIRPASADTMRKNVNFTSALLSKVEGGRCRNNRPLDMSVKNLFKTDKKQLERKAELITKLRLYEVIVVDIDIASCYGEGQRNQEYPIGCPEIFDYRHSKNNAPTTLREWLSMYEVKIDKIHEAVRQADLVAWQNPANWGELVPGVWHLRMSNKAPLKYLQDLFASWFMDNSHGVEMLAKAHLSMKCDTETLSTTNAVFNQDEGNLKILNQDIKNAVLTHDGLQWIFAITSKRQRNELLDNLYVDSSMVYPASTRIDGTSGKKGLATLISVKASWKGVNTTERVRNVDGITTLRMNSQEYHGWFSINMGTLIIDNLLIERLKAKIMYGKKSPLDLLFKLCINTLYGDMVSKYFLTSNPTVGNNITARARCLAWYMEKGLHGFPTVTDGCTFEVNRVMLPSNYPINGECVNLYRSGSKLDSMQVKKGYLGGSGITCKWIDTDLVVGGDPFDFQSVEWDGGKPYLTVEGMKYKCDEGWIKKIEDANSTEPLKPESLIRHKKPVFIIDGVEIVNTLEWINVKAMGHLQKYFPLVDVLHKQSECLTVNVKTLEVERSTRVGQYSFETKDVYHSASFHGSANYMLENPNGKLVKARGYETTRKHDALEVEFDDDDENYDVIKCDRYDNGNNPAKDLMQQILDNPTSIKRQIPAIKSGILKVGDYHNLAEKYDALGIEPGDNILKTVLMQEFSLSQFTFLTYEQFSSWKKVVDKAKLKHHQSLEGYFLNDDMSLNLQALSEWTDNAIATGIMNPFAELDKHRNGSRSVKRSEAQAVRTETRGRVVSSLSSIDHPQFEALNILKAQLNISVEERTELALKARTVRAIEVQGKRTIVTQTDRSVEIHTEPTIEAQTERTVNFQADRAVET